MKTIDQTVFRPHGLKNKANYVYYTRWGKFSDSCSTFTSDQWSYYSGKQQNRIIEVFPMQCIWGCFPIYDSYWENFLKWRTFYVFMYIIPLHCLFYRNKQKLYILNLMNKYVPWVIKKLGQFLMELSQFFIRITWWFSNSLKTIW